MKVIQVTEDMNVLALGMLGENNRTTFVFDVSDWLEEYPDATIGLANRLPYASDSYPCTLTDEGDGKYSWTITSAELSVAGKGKCQLQAVDGDVVAKKKKYTTDIGDALDPDADPPAEWESYITTVTGLAGDAEDAAEDAEAYAAGTRGGEPVSSDDPAYHNNAKYYAETVDPSIKADKVEDAVEGNFAGLDENGNLTDSGHKHSDYLTSHQDISGKADKVSSTTSGNFAGLDSNGNLTDSGKKPADFLTSHQDISGKADKVSDATEDNFAGLDSNGNLKDSGKKASDFLTSHQDITGKADKVQDATYGNFAALDGSGNLTDSGHKPSDYLTSHQDITGKADRVQSATAGHFAALDSNGNLTDSGHKHSDYITDVSGKADKVYNPTSGNFAALDGSGNLTDSGKKASDFLTEAEAYYIQKADFTNPATVNSNASEVINAGILAAAEAGKQYCIIPDGEYWLTETVYLADGVILCGSGMDATVLKIADGADIDAIRVHGPINNSGIMDLAIDGNRITNYSVYEEGHHGNAINVWLHYGRIERVRTNWVYKHSLMLNYDTGSGDDGLGFEPAHQDDVGNLNKVLWCDFRDSLMQGVMWGWRTMDSWMCYTNIGSHAANLYLEGGTSRFIGNHFDGDGDNGAGPEYNVYCADGCTAMLFSENIFENTQKENIFFRQPSYRNGTKTITINSNIIRTCSKSADNTYANIRISGYDAATAAEQITITGNQILNPDTSANHGYAGIHLDYCKDVKISGNTYFNVGADHVKIENTCENCLNDDDLSEAVSDVKNDLNSKQDAPETAGTAGQVLGLDSQLNPVWVNQQGGGSEHGVPSGGTTGQVLAKNSGTDYDLKWANPPAPTDAQVESAVSAWIEAHPEAVTTVEDGAITRAKLADTLKADTDAVGADLVDHGLAQYFYKSNTYIKSGAETALNGYDLYKIPVSYGDVIEVKQTSGEGNFWGALNKVYAFMTIYDGSYSNFGVGVDQAGNFTFKSSEKDMVGYVKLPGYTYLMVCVQNGKEGNVSVYINSKDNIRISNSMLVERNNFPFALSSSNCFITNVYPFNTTISTIESPYTCYVHTIEEGYRIYFTGKYSGLNSYGMYVTADDSTTTRINSNPFIAPEDGYVCIFVNESDMLPVTFAPNGLKVDYSQLTNTPESPFAGMSAVAFGTSLTYRAQTTTGYLVYLPTLSGITFDNQGVGSSTILGNGGSTDMLATIKGYSSYSGKKICTIEGFCNDWYQNKTLGTWKDTGETTVCGCVRSALNYILSQNANLTVFLILDPYGRNYNGVDVSTTAVNASNLTQFEYYEEIAKVANSLGIPVIKQYAESQISENTPQFIADDIHPTAKGALQSANFIWSKMKQYYPNNVSE